MFSICYVTTPSKVVAEKLAEHLVLGKMAACVNIIPQVTSVYEWEGKLQKDEEALMMIKTQTSLVESVVAAVKKEHPYDVPEVISVPMGEGNNTYLDWVKLSTTKAPTTKSD